MTQWIMADWRKIPSTHIYSGGLCIHFAAISTSYCSSINLSSIFTQGMWAIFGQSSPFSFEHLWIRSGQSLIYSSESMSGSPSLGIKDWSLGHRKTSSFLREVSVWRDRKAKDSRFWKREMQSSTRVVGRRNKWWWWLEKEVASGNMPPMVRVLREVNLARPHSDKGTLIFSQLVIWSDAREVRFRNRWGCKSRFSHFSIRRSLRL